MKIVSLLLAFAITGLARGQDRESDELMLRTEVHEFDSPVRGPVHVEKTFRGKELIMRTMTYSNKMVRMLILGDSQYVEADEDGDGFFESVMLSGEGIDEFEVFTRERDGTLKPLPEKEYSDLKATTIEATTNLLRFLEDSGALLEPGAAHEPPSAAPVRNAAETMASKPQSEAPADGGGR